MLERVRAGDPRFEADLDCRLVRQPFELRPDESIVKVLRDSAESVTGPTPPLSSMHGWTDCALLADAGIPSVVFGPHGRGGHAATEYVDVVSVQQLVDILFRTAAEFCSAPRDEVLK